MGKIKAIIYGAIALFILINLAINITTFHWFGTFFWSVIIIILVAKTIQNWTED